MNYQTIKVRIQEPFCYLQFHRPEANNTINDVMIKECHEVLADCEDDSIKVIVLEGLPETFCFGADFGGMHEQMSTAQPREQDPGPMYDLWLKLAAGPYVTVSHVRGAANAGGVGFVAASDIVIADHSAKFSLSELLFGLFPACVMPFLIRRIGFQRAHYMTLMTKPISVEQAHTWGLVDAYNTQSDGLVRQHLLRLRYLSKKAIGRYKNYMAELDGALTKSKEQALAANLEVFSDPQNLASISRYVGEGKFPWED